LDFETGLKLFDLVFDGKLKGKDINNLDISKHSLKFLLKYHMAKAKA
jgi:hypothetical protein